MAGASSAFIWLVHISTLLFLAGDVSAAVWHRRQHHEKRQVAISTDTTTTPSIIRPFVVATPRLSSPATFLDLTQAGQLGSSADRSGVLTPSALTPSGAFNSSPLTVTVSPVPAITSAPILGFNISALPTSGTFAGGQISGPALNLTTVSGLVAPTIPLLNATPIATDQTSTSFQPLYTLCQPAIAFPSNLGANITRGKLLQAFNGNAAPTTSSGSLGLNNSKCFTVYQPVAMPVCTTTLTGIAAQYTVTACDQNITYSSQYGYSLVIPTGNNSQTPYVVTETTYIAAPWQQLTAGQTPSVVDVEACTPDPTNNGGNFQTCVRYYETMVTSTVTSSGLTTVPLTIDTTISGPNFFIVESYTANITESFRKISLETTLTSVTYASSAFAALPAAATTAPSVTGTSTGETVYRTLSLVAVTSTLPGGSVVVSDVTEGSSPPTTSTVDITTTSTIYSGTLTVTSTRTTFSYSTITFTNMGNAAPSVVPVAASPASSFPFIPGAGPAGPSLSTLGVMTMTTYFTPTPFAASPPSAVPAADTAITAPPPLAPLSTPSIMTMTDVSTSVETAAALVPFFTASGSDDSAPTVIPSIRSDTTAPPMIPVPFTPPTSDSITASATAPDVDANGSPTDLDVVVATSMVHPFVVSDVPLGNGEIGDAPNTAADAPTDTATDPATQPPLPTLAGLPLPGASDTHAPTTAAIEPARGFAAMKKLFNGA